MEMRILYITRKYPPMKGGMEQANFHLSQHLNRISDVEIIAWGRSQKWLPLVLVHFLVRSIAICLRKRQDVIHVGDALLSPLGALLKILFRRPSTATAYGLDLTWDVWPYRRIVAASLKRLDRVVCISEETVERCLQLGIPRAKVTRIPLAVEPSDFALLGDRTHLADRVREAYGIDLTHRRILLSVGRFVERKGFHWFLQEVMPHLVAERDDVVYILVGYGPLRRRLEEAISSRGLDGHCYIVDDRQLPALYNLADALVMPNIPVPGDMEGFGIVAVEAASAGTPVVASRMEGIRDAVVEGETGLLVEPAIPQAFIEAIDRLLDDEQMRDEVGHRARNYVNENLTWECVAERYLDEFGSVLDRFDGREIVADR